MKMISNICESSDGYGALAQDRHLFISWNSSTKIGRCHRTCTSSSSYITLESLRNRAADMLSATGERNAVWIRSFFFYVFLPRVVCQVMLFQGRKTRRDSNWLRTFFFFSEAEKQIACGCRRRLTPSSIRQLDGRKKERKKKKEEDGMT